MAEYAFTGSGYLGVKGKWKGCEQPVMLINVYAPQERSAKKELWEELVKLRLTSPALWCLFGDFNAVRKPGKRKGYVFDHGKAADFNDFIGQVNLQEIGMGAKRFTWIGQGGLKLSKLDGFLLSKELLDVWTGLSVIGLKRIFSDYCLILLKSGDYNFGPTSFKFFDSWLHEEGFENMICDSWKEMVVTGCPSYCLKEN